MLLSSILSLALATAATAAPAPTTAPPKNKEFTVDFLVPLNDVVLTYKARAVSNTTNPKPTDPVFLIGDLTFNSRGTPAFFTGNKTNKALNFDLTASPRPKLRRVYSAFVPEVGDWYGHALDIVGLPTPPQDYLWGESDGQIVHRLQAAINLFYLCSDTIAGKPAQVLRWGSPMSNGTALVPPVGCVGTVLRQNFDVPGGAKQG